jgi:protein-tyrosine phosphatase
VWMQITAGSLTGAFGKTARYWAERMLDEGRVHILATDAHDTEKRSPNLGRGRDLAAARISIEEAHHLVVTRPAGVIANVAPSTLPMPHATNVSSETDSPDAYQRRQSETGTDNPDTRFARTVRRLFR